MAKTLYGIDSDVMRVLKNLPLTKEAAAAAGIDAGMMAGARVKRALSRNQKGNTPPWTMFPSEIGKPCLRSMWFDRHYDPATMLPVEEIGPATKLKFMYGDMIESIAVPLLKATGRKITGLDERLVRSFVDSDGATWQISGRTDVVVDDCVVDIKSMSGISFKMFTTVGIPGADSFGYRWQLHTYNWLANSENESGLLGINKENGNVRLIQNEPTDLKKVEERLQVIASAVKDPNRMPQGIPDEAEGASGNMKLSTICSYCKYKDECWGRYSNGGTGLRKFLYAGNKVVYLTAVAKTPKVPEIT